MDLLVRTIHMLFELPLSLLDLLPAWASLTLISIVSGAGMLWVVGRLTDQRRLERARDQMSSAIYEIRLYLDSPLQITRAQVRLVRSSFAYIGLTLPPLLVLAAPLGLLFLHLEARFDMAPLPVGRDAVVVVELTKAPSRQQIRVASSEGIRATAPLLIEARRAFLRVRPERAGAHELVVEAFGERVTKALFAGEEAKASPERLRGWEALLTSGLERPLPSDSVVRAIRIHHPTSEYHLFGVVWWIYFLVVATGAAMLLRGPMGVVL